MSQVNELSIIRGELPRDVTIMIETTGGDYEDDLSSTTTADSTGRFLRRTGIARDNAGDAKLTLRSKPETMTGFDGETCWVSEASGFTRDLSFSDRDIPLFLAWLRTGLWLDRIDPAKLRLDPGESKGDRVVFLVSQKGLPSQVAVSSKTGLVESFRFKNVQGEVTCEYFDYQKHHGLTIPHRVKVTSSLGVRESKVASVKMITGTIDFAKPTQKPAAITFASGEPAKLPLQRTPSGHVLIDVALADGKLRKFIFDTGAGGTVIDSTLAEGLKLNVIDDQALGSIFGTQNMPVYSTSRLRIGPATLEYPRLVSMDLALAHDWWTPAV